MVSQHHQQGILPPGLPLSPADEIAQAAIGIASRSHHTLTFATIRIVPIRQIVGLMVAQGEIEPKERTLYRIGILGNPCEKIFIGYAPLAVRMRYAQVTLIINLLHPPGQQA